MGKTAIAPIFFEDPNDLRAWFEEHHSTAPELYVGFYKKGVDIRAVNYEEAVTQALCFGWIDSVARGIDERTYAQRFTPRKKKSYWSAVNVAKAEALIAGGQMHEAGLRSFEERDRDAAPRYSFEQPTDSELDPEMIERFQANPAAWEFWDRQTPSYKKRLTWWVISAKKPETRLSRLDKLIASSADGTKME